MVSHFKFEVQVAFESRARPGRPSRSRPISHNPHGHQQSRPTILDKHKLRMALPPELVDDILIYLRHDKRTLLNCSLAAKSWVCRSQKLLHDWHHCFTPETHRTWQETASPTGAEQLQHVRSLTCSRFNRLLPSHRGYFKSFPRLLHITLRTSGPSNRISPLSYRISRAPSRLYTSVMLPSDDFLGCCRVDCLGLSFWSFWTDPFMGSVFLPRDNMLSSVLPCCSGFLCGRYISLRPLLSCTCMYADKSHHIVGQQSIPEHILNSS